MAAGAIEERVDYEVGRVIDNILDATTKPDAKRKITITLEFQPDSEHKHISLNATAKSALAPTTPVSTSMVITADGNGEMVVAEMVPQIPGQYNMAGEEQPQPKILKFVNNG
ncbi:MAG: hypothetical protein IJ649_03825 [Oscillospiraceae bacterium]|nr:hypothetical protein [Oscillospiraceae bacterium]